MQAKIVGFRKICLLNHFRSKVPKFHKYCIKNCKTSYKTLILTDITDADIRNYLKLSALSFQTIILLRISTGKILYFKTAF